MTDELARLDATSQAELVAQGKISAQELCEAAIARLERLNPQLNAVVRTDIERARAAGKRTGPFAGVPTLLKDTGAAEAGQAVHQGMRALKDADLRETQDSYLFLKLKAAGFVSLGRTNMPELAIVATTEPEAYGPTRNPWNLEHSAGGSSGGSAAAVAAGIVPVAHASDGGGSIRGPASICGLVGLKTTRGRCSMGPQRGERWSSLSVEFMLTRSVRDCAALLDVLAGPAPGDPYHAAPPAKSYASALQDKLKPLRIGLLAHAPSGIEVGADPARVVRDTAKALEQLGHHVEEAYPAALDEAETPLVWVQLVATNVARALDAQGTRLGRVLTQDDVEPLTFAMAEAGRALSAPQLLLAIEQMHSVSRRLTNFFDNFDLLLTPTQALPPPRLGHLTSTREEPWRALFRCSPYGTFTLPWNMSGQPAVSLPMGMTADGLPIGAHLVAGFGREDLLLQVAAQLELARPWAARTPPVFG